MWVNDGGSTKEHDVSDIFAQAGKTMADVLTQASFFDGEPLDGAAAARAAKDGLDNAVGGASGVGSKIIEGASQQAAPDALDGVTEGISGFGSKLSDAMSSFFDGKFAPGAESTEVAPVDVADGASAPQADAGMEL